MRAMGLRRLVLAAPRSDALERHPDAISRASGALDVLLAVRTRRTLAEALAPYTLAVAISADTREFGPVPQPPESIVAAVHAEAMADPSHRIAMVFGCERTGLSIEELQRCQLVCSIPGERDYASLNLAQAVQIIAYCLRAHERLGGLPRAAGPDAPSRLATQAQVAGLFEHLERALVHIDFLDPRHPKKLMPRLRRLFSRTRLEVEEVDLLRGICTQTEKHANRHRGPTSPVPGAPAGEFADRPEGSGLGESA